MSYKRPQQESGTDLVLASNVERTVSEHRFREFSADIIKEAEERISERDNGKKERKERLEVRLEAVKKKIAEKQKELWDRIHELGQSQDGRLIDDHFMQWLLNEKLEELDVDRVTLARYLYINRSKICAYVEKERLKDSSTLYFNEFAQLVFEIFHGIDGKETIEPLVKKYTSSDRRVFKPLYYVYKILSTGEANRDRFVSARNKEEMLHAIYHMIYLVINLPEKREEEAMLESYRALKDSLDCFERENGDSKDLCLDLSGLEATAGQIDILLRLKGVKGEINEEVMSVLIQDLFRRYYHLEQQEEFKSWWSALKNWKSRFLYKLHWNREFMQGAPDAIEAFYSMVEWCTNLHKRGQIIINSGRPHRLKEGQLLVEIARIYIERLNDMAVDIEQLLQVGDMDMANLQEHMATLSAFRRGERSVMSLIEEHEMQLAAALEAEDLTGKGAEERELDEFQLKLVGTDGS